MQFFYLYNVYDVNIQFLCLLLKHTWINSVALAFRWDLLLEFHNQVLKHCLFLLCMHMKNPSLKKKTKMHFFWLWWPLVTRQLSRVMWLIREQGFQLAHELKHKRLQTCCCFPITLFFRIISPVFLESIWATIFVMELENGLSSDDLRSFLLSDRKTGAKDPPKIKLL